MKADMAYIKVILTVIAGAAVWGAVNSGAGEPLPGVVGQAVAAPAGGIPDSGRVAYETNEKLDQVNENLRTLNAKLEAILTVLRSGKMEVVVKEAGAKGAEARENQAGGG